VNRRRRVVAACIAVVALGGLSSCSSQPSNRRVVSDVIESMQLPPAQEACMLERLETYTDDQLDAIADENENWDPAGGSTLAEASEGMRLFIDDFAECTSEGGSAGEPTGTSEPGAATEPGGSTEPAEATEPADSAAPSTATATTAD
jgi:hypothetical protein